MKKYLLKSGLAFLLLVSPYTLSYANTVTIPANNVGPEKTFVLRIISLDTNNAAPFMAQ